MKTSRRKFLRLAAGVALLPAVGRFAWAQAYPSRPVRIVVPQSAGSGTDTAARLLGPWLSERLGQPFTIENQAGAGGNRALRGDLHPRARDLPTARACAPPRNAPGAWAAAASRPTRARAHEPGQVPSTTLASGPPSSLAAVLPHHAHRVGAWPGSMRDAASGEAAAAQAELRHT